MVPEIIPAKIFTLREGFSPGLSSPDIMFLIGVYNPILSPANTIYLCKPADSPFHNAKNPSSFEIVLIVPMNPLYFGAIVGSIAFAYIWSLTLAVSRGRVKHSAAHPEKDADKILLAKNLNFDSLSGLVMFIKLYLLA